MNNDFCCERLQAWIKCKDCPLRYYPEFRAYSMTVPQYLLRKNEIWVGFPVSFCPACGTKFPPDLSEERMKILKNEYGIKDTYFQKKLIPKEFKTDEWWKKRGL